MHRITLNFIDAIAMRSSLVSFVSNCIPIQQTEEAKKTKHYLDVVDVEGRLYLVATVPLKHCLKERFGIEGSSLDFHRLALRNVFHYGMFFTLLYFSFRASELSPSPF